MRIQFHRYITHVMWLRAKLILLHIGINLDFHAKMFPNYHFISHSNSDGRKSPDEEFTCYCYPGHLPGNAFGFNTAGFVFGVNALYPKLMVLNTFR